MNAPRPRLLGEVARATLDNAVSLVDDARLLLSHARYPRTYALAILAMEEFGKYLSCVGAAAVDQGNFHYWDKFYQNLKSHAAKYCLAWVTLTAAMPTAIGTSLQTQLVDKTREEQELKIRALYVDMKGGQVLNPSDVNETVAREALRMAREMIMRWAQHWDGVDLPARFEQGIAHQDPSISEAMAAANAADLAQLLNNARRGA